MDRRAWRVMVRRFAKNWTQLKELSMHIPFFVDSTYIC